MLNPSKSWQLLNRMSEQNKDDDRLLTKKALRPLASKAVFKAAALFFESPTLYDMNTSKFLLEAGNES